MIHTIAQVDSSSYCQLTWLYSLQSSIVQASRLFLNWYHHFDSLLLLHASQLPTHPVSVALQHANLRHSPATHSNVRQVSGHRENGPLDRLALMRKREPQSLVHANHSTHFPRRSIATKQYQQQHHPACRINSENIIENVSWLKQKIIEQETVSTLMNQFNRHFASIKSSAKIKMRTFLEPEKHQKRHH